VKINFDLDSYKTRFLGGARSYLFFCIFQFPGTAASTSLASAVTALTGSSIAGSIAGFAQGALSPFGLGAGQDLVSYLVRSTSLPSSHVEEKTVEWPGLAYKYAGNRVYDDWSVIFNVDEQGKILQKFTEWQRLIEDPMINKRALSGDYMRDQQICLIDYSGNSLQLYTLHGAWPKSVNAVALDYSNNDVAQVEIVFSYQFHEAMDPPGAAMSDIIKRGAQKLMGIL
jgi:hypothetical protein